MPKPSVKGSELPLRQSPRLRTSTSSSITDRSPKLGLMRSGGPNTDPLTQKKLGGRISGLELQLGPAQEELGLLKEQLSKAETAKKRAQDELRKKKTKKPKQPRDHDVPDKETDVFEVVRDDDMNVLKARLYDLEKENVSVCKENESLKDQLKKMDLEMLSGKAKEDEMVLKVSRIGEELEESNEEAAKLKKKLELMEEAKESLEAEMRKLIVQTEQWRKAADAAAAVLSGGVDMNGLFSERCGSMEKHFGGGFMGSPPGIGDGSEDGNGKRKGSGIKMFGDLWRKKGQK